MGLLAVGHAVLIPKLAIDPNSLTVSGISSGAFMAVQLHVTYSATFKGCGALAGGPYFCAQDDVFTALGTCMNGTPPVPVSELIDITANTVAFGYADDTSNLLRSKVWMMSALNDTVVATDVVEALAQYYRHYLADDSQIATVMNRPGEHSMQTLDYGNSCQTLGEPFINKCGYDAAGAILQHLLGPLKPPAVADQNATGTFVELSQRAFMFLPYLTAYGLAEEAWVYIPPQCENADTTCHLHVALHGCLQSIPIIGQQYVRDAGYNRWADANDIVVLYPQAIKTALNPKSCWDWWGYSGTDYASNLGIQPSTIKGMVDALVTQQQPAEREEA